MSRRGRVNLGTRPPPVQARANEVAEQLRAAHRADGDWSLETLSGTEPVRSRTSRSVLRRSSDLRSTSAGQRPDSVKEVTLTTNGSGQLKGASIANFSGGAA